MSNFERGFFNNEDVSSSIKFAVLAILNRGNADEFSRGVNGNVPVIMANFPAEYGISSIGFDVGNEAVSNGNLLIKVKENESLDNALRRFKRQTAKDGVIQEVRKREHYEKPSVKRKKKSEAARKRKFR